MKKIKTFMLEHKIFFTVLLVAISLLGLEYVLVNNYVDKKTNPKKNKPSNITSNLNDLNNKQKSLIGINSNTNSDSNKSSVTTDTIIEDKKEKKKEELTNSNLNKDYIDYEKLSDDEKAKVDVIPSKDKIDIDKLDKIDDKTINTIPTKYNLADKININFESQGSYGLCWNFATTKVFETYLELNYNKQYNFSEIAMDYLASPNLYHFGFMLHGGGNFDIYNKVVKKIGGLIESKNVKQGYSHDFTEDEYKNLLALPRVTINNYEVVRFPTLYSVDNKLVDTNDKEVSKEDLVKYREAVKKHIMTNSAVYFTINVESSATYEIKGNLKPNDNYIKMVNGSDKTFFCKGNDCDWRSGSHAMALIGWDDSFDKRMFKQTDEKGKVYYPESDGAFIVANSWSNEKEYYYISYEDTELYSDMIGIKKLDTSDMSKYLNITNLNKGFKKELSSYTVVINNQEYVSYDDLAAISYLQLSNYNLTSNDLNILKYFTNLEYLDIGNNNITDISSLSTLKELTNLEASNNKITDISPLNSLTKLETLYLENNNISDITPIKDLFELNTLLLDNNKLTNYENVFNNLNGLSILSLENCNIGDIAFGSNELLSLDLSSNPNLKFISKVNANIIELDNNNLSNLDILANVDDSKLRSISLVNNDIKDISILTNYKSLVSINLSENKNITNIDKVIDIFGKNDKVENKDKDENNDNTEELKNGVTSLLEGIFNSIKKYDEDHIDIDEDSLDDENDSEPGGYIYTVDKELFLNDCNISDITLFNDLNVSTLSLMKNNITNIDNFKNINVSFLYLSDNQIGNIDFDKLITDNLEELFLSNVGLKEIKLSKSVKKQFISILDLSNNDITDISNLNGIASINILSLENNINFKDYNLTNEVNFINLSNTAVDDTIIDKMNYENLYLINLSNNKNIKDVDKLVIDMENKCKELENKLNAERVEDEEEYDYEYSIHVSLVLDDSTLNISPFNDHVKVDANYLVTLDKENDGSVNLLKGNNFGIFKMLTSIWSIEVNNMTLSKDFTKMNINENSYMSFYSLNDSSKKYIIRFN